MTSRRWSIVARGGPEVLQLVEEPAPDPGRGQVRIAVRYAGVAFGDVMRRRGLLAPRRPFTPGYDVVGWVEAVGPGSAMPVGARVAAVMPRIGIGGYAEHVIVPEWAVASIPEAVTSREAIALGLNYISAHQILTRLLHLSGGETVLVHGGAGGVGTALLDLGSRAGLRLFATASAPKHGTVAAFGAEAIDYQSVDFVDRVREAVPGGVDAVTDPIGGDHLLRSARVLRRGGTLIGFGLTADVDAGFRALLHNASLYGRLYLRPGLRFRAYGFGVPPTSGRRSCVEDWDQLLETHERSPLRPVIGAEIPFEDAPRAHALVDGSQVAGKIILRVGDP